MKFSCMAALLLVITAATFASSVQTLAELQEEWRRINFMTPPKHFDQLIPKLVTYRNEKGDRSWQLNYMLGSSYCQTPGQEKNGRIVLARVLASYGVPDAARAAAESVLVDCEGHTQTVPEPSFNVVPVSGQTGAVVHGKGGYEVSSDSKLKTNKIQAVAVSSDQLQRRVFASSKSAEAQQAALALAKRVNPSARSAVVDGFVVTSVELPPEMTGHCLARYRRLLQSEFDMQPPAMLITVYTAAEPEQVPDYAARLHGVHLPLGTIAYSVYEDLSIIGVAAAEACGSLAHELVHLMIRQNFSDSPAWLEEGLASEIAVAAIGEKSFRFGRSWREQALRQHWELRPSVSQLLRKTWADYATDNTSQLSPVVALHAMAASFIRYLDDKKALVPVYTRMRDSLSSSDLKSDEDIVTRQLGMSLEQIDSDFIQWSGYSKPK